MDALTIAFTNQSHIQFLNYLNARKDENHKISKEIVDNNDFIFMEDLTLKGMQNLWGNKIKQLGLGQLTMFIKYKAENQGNTERTSKACKKNKRGTI